MNVIPSPKESADPLFPGRAVRLAGLRSLTCPERGELGRDQFVVPDLPFEGADLAANRLMLATISAVIVGLYASRGRTVAP